MGNFRSSNRGGFGGGNRSFGNNRGGFGDRRRSDGPREMHDATCSNCGKPCQVPFRPTGSKPVLCSDCYEKKGSESNFNQRSNDKSSSNGISQEQFNQINKKLDKILEILEDLEIVEGEDSEEDMSDDSEDEEDSDEDKSV